MIKVNEAIGESERYSFSIADYSEEIDEYNCFYESVTAAILVKDNKIISDPFIKYESHYEKHDSEYKEIEITNERIFRLNIRTSEYLTGYDENCIGTGKEIDYIDDSLRTEEYRYNTYWEAIVKFFNTIFKTDNIEFEELQLINIPEYSFIDVESEE